MWSIILALWFFPNAAINADAYVNDHYMARSDRWEPLVAYVWEEWGRTDLDLAMDVLHCESSGLPKIKHSSSGASGLFQHMPQWWPERSAQAGVAGADVLNPFYNVWVAAWLVTEHSWWHWECYER